MFFLSPLTRWPRTYPCSAGLPLAMLVAAIATGCSQNPYFAGTNFGPAGGNNSVWNSPRNAAVPESEARIAELSRRVQLLDDNNRQLHTQLAQTEQQTQVFRDESELLRKQLAEVSQQMRSTKIAAQQAEDRVRGMQASTQLRTPNSGRSPVRGEASITPNTNLSQMVSRLNLGGVPVLADGSVIRILVPSDQLFQPGTGQLHPQAAATLDPIAAQLRSLFPTNRIGIEGYSDNGPLYGGAVSSTHQLTAAQSAAVLDLLTRRSGFPPNQLFTVAQGANNPRQSNETAAGRAANRRIELVIYPDNY